MLLLLSVVLALGIASSVKATVSPTLHYKVTLKSESFGDMGIREVWLKADKMRCNMKSGNLPISLVKNDKGVFMINILAKVAGKYPEGSPRGNPTALLPGPNCSPKTFLRDVKAVKVAQQKVGKQLCTVYSYTEPTTRRVCKLWVNAKSGKPAKLWMQGKHKVMDTITASYTTFDEGAKISDSVFELPKGYAIRPMPNRELAINSSTRQLHIVKPGR